MNKSINQKTWLGRGKLISTAMFNNNSAWSSHLTSLCFISLICMIRIISMSIAEPTLIVYVSFNSTFKVLRTVSSYTLNA